MDNDKKIRTVIIDDDKNSIFSLQEHLLFFPEIDLLGTASQYAKAKLLLQCQPDLVFLDIEMPCKNGFDLLHEARKNGCNNMSVIFYTAYDRYLIQALRESAFDYILKPVDRNELKDAIERYKRAEKLKQDETQPLYHGLPGITEMVALPTGTGIRFVDKNCIVLFQFQTESYHEKPAWVALLNDFSKVKLPGTTAKEITAIMGEERFVTINPSVIANLIYLATIEFKTRDCILLPPYDNIKLTVSRAQLSSLRYKFDLL